MKWSKEEVILLQELYPNYPTNDLVEIFHRNRDAINCKAKEMGIKRLIDMLVMVLQIKNTILMKIISMKKVEICFMF